MLPAELLKTPRWFRSSAEDSPGERRQDAATILPLLHDPVAQHCVFSGEQILHEFVAAFVRVA